MFSGLSEEELIMKVLKCDYDVLENISILEFFNKDDLCSVSNNLLKNFKPYTTDFMNNKKPESDVTHLARADRIYVELCINLRHYWRSRSRALLVVKTYEKDYQDLLTKLQRVDDSVQAIKNSKALKNLFVLIREIGNFMNRKQVEGFRLSSLSKLNFVKDQNQKTFLHYVEKVIRRAYPEYLTFLQELILLQDTSKISVDQLSADTLTFVQSIRNIQKSIESGNLSNPKVFHPDDRVLTKVSVKLPGALRKCQLLEDQHKLIMNDFDKLMIYFGEDSSDTVAKSTFLQKFLDFMHDFKKVQIENIDSEEKDKIYQKGKELMLQSKKAREQRSKSEGGGNDSEHDVVDNLLKRLKGISSDRRRVSTGAINTTTPSTARSTRSTEDDIKLLSRAQTMLEDTKEI
ncbi:formin BNR1 [Cyberlindnera jadinii NRRL Y-1542]|uniref:Actin-binding FH2 n=1 Tax=Cyberlindnera jadinii (strain ATCC 18201 / CBS 1600 / BCRC 20928 / JCM 3617 / NBRC 0987 / NRRL Y-1542) TaxID=983966 RepID=A0A1E4S9K3_CYBJN|nr:actin-binding FH2 [Cyberlindnera jadinii NRRL Y-1542]ODV76190.1 actin-binding FH2 [Cyberlindnera jadinii NRRL Y-1542]